jgi:3-hydroxyacyl-CoA dehydrogenase / 3-hydroxy-2-methylbutyryl-CoA dehydrogenase
MELSKCNAIVTGGASGLGEATVRAIVAAGGKTAIIDLNQELGKKLSTELGESAFYHSGDISGEEEMDQVVGQIKSELGSINAVVNCAGIGGSVKVVGRDGVMPMERFNRTVGVNLQGTFNMIRATAETLMENTPNEEGERGVYINTASIAAFDGQIGQAAYSASKGGIVSMTLTLAREFAANGIRVMCILPGIMHTPLLANNPQNILDRLASQVPFPVRLGKSEEFASLACHILQNPYLNGEFIRLDGALRMGFGRKEK